MTGPKQTTAGQVQRRWGFAFALLVVVAGPWMLTSVGLASAVAGGGWVWPAANDLGATLVHLVSNPTRPAAAYPPVDAARVASDAAVCIAAFALLVPICALTYGWAYWRAGRRGNGIRRQETQLQRERARSSAWGSGKETTDLATSGAMSWDVGEHGGHSIRTKHLESLGVWAPTGSGKTARIVIRNVIRLCEAGVPRVVASIKTDVLALTYSAATKAGPVYVFAPGATGQAKKNYPMCRWNLLSGCRTFGGARDTAAWLSRSQRAEQSGTSDNMKFWDDLGRKMLAPMLWLAATTGGDMTQVLRWVEYTDEDTVKEKLAAQPAGQDRDDAVAMWAATCAREARQKSSVYSTAEGILTGFDHPDVRELMTGEPGEPDVYTPAKLLDQKTTLYLAATKSKCDDFGAVFDAMMAQLVAEVENRCQANDGQPIRGGLALILEEAANIAKVRALGYFVSALRGMGVLVMTVWQDEPQIELNYGHAAARSIIENHSWKLYLPGTTDPDSLDRLSRRIGTYLATEHTHSADVDGDRGSTSTRYTDVAGATPADLARMDPDTAILCARNRKPIRVRTVPYFTDSALREKIGEDICRRFDASLGGPV